MYDSSLASQSLEVAYAIAERVKDCDKFARDFQPIGEVFAGNDWQEYFNAASLGGGHTGVALLFSALERVDGREEWALLAARHFERAVNEKRQLSGLHSGLAGLLAVSRYAANGTKRYQTMRRNITANLLEGLDGLTLTLPLNDVSRYDVIAGFCGIFLALQTIPTFFTDRFIKVFSDERLWRTPVPSLERYGLCNNLGLAHGVSGVLASLNVSDKDPALDLLAEDLFRYLFSHATDDGKGLLWGCAVDERGDILPARFGWCYGTPGTAAVLWHTASRLGHAAAAEQCIAALASIAERSQTEMHVQDSAICHGRVGIALCLHSVGVRAERAELIDAANILARQVVAAFDESLPFGYKAVNPQGIIDDHRFLTGAVGIAVALLTLAFEQASGWQHPCLGLPC